ncbi:hypothetical protein ACFSZS_08600 [Seohaeicola zhoushanensis]
MTPFNMRPKLNSIFLKIAAILVVTVGLVIGTVKYVDRSIPNGWRSRSSPNRPCPIRSWLATSSAAR